MTIYDIGRAIATLLVGAIIVVGFKMAVEEWRKAYPTVSNPEAEHAFLISGAAILAGVCLFFVGYNIFWVRGFHLGWPIGAGLLVCSGISFKKLASPQAKQEARSVRFQAAMVALLAAMLGVAGLGMGFGARHVPLFH